MILSSMTSAAAWINKGWSFSPPSAGGGGNTPGNTTTTTKPSSPTTYPNPNTVFDEGTGAGPPKTPTTMAPYSDLPDGEILSAYRDGALTYAEAYAALTYGYEGLSPLSAQLQLRQYTPSAQVIEMPQHLQVVQGAIQNWLVSLGKDANFDDATGFAEHFLGVYWNQVANRINAYVSQDYTGEDYMMRNGFGVSAGAAMGFPQDDPEAVARMIDIAKEYLAPLWSYGPVDFGGGRGYGRGSGGGAGSLRGSFDIDQLAQGIRQMWSLYLRATPNVNAHGLAKAYVDQVVANPAQTLDFSTWVKGRMKEDPKWKFTFQNKPHGVSPEEYMQGYAGAIIGTLGQQKGIGQAIRGQAALNATPGDVQGFLGMQDQIIRSTGFMGNIEERFRSARKILGVLA